MKGQKGKLKLEVENALLQIKSLNYCWNQHISKRSDFYFEGEHSLFSFLPFTLFTDTFHANEAICSRKEVFSSPIHHILQTSLWPILPSNSKQPPATIHSWLRSFHFSLATSGYQAVANWSARLRVWGLSCLIIWKAFIESFTIALVFEIGEFSPLRPLEEMQV